MLTFSISIVHPLCSCLREVASSGDISHSVILRCHSMTFAKFTLVSIDFEREKRNVGFDPCILNSSSPRHERGGRYFSRERVARLTIPRILQFAAQRNVLRKIPVPSRVSSLFPFISFNGERKKSVSSRGGTQTAHARAFSRNVAKLKLTRTNSSTLCVLARITRNENVVILLS